MAKKIFETKKINMETLPEYLKAARESFSYDLRHIAKITNISEKFLLALEEGHYHRLPADVYVYGFLRKLAELYLADSDLLISQYEKERGINENINRSSNTKSALRPQPLRSKFVLTPRTMAFSGAAILVLFVIGYITYQVHAINQPPLIKITDPADGSVIHDSSIVLRGQTDPGANLSIDGQAVQVDSGGNFTEPISVSSGTKILTFDASNSFGKHSSKQISIIGDLSGQNTATIASQSFSLTVSDDPNPTVVTVVIDGGQPEVVTFQKGDTKTFNATQKIVLSTADAGSTYIQINGGQKFKLGKPGQILSVLAFPVASSNSGGGPTTQAVLGASTDSPADQTPTSGQNSNPIPSSSNQNNKNSTLSPGN